MVRPLKGVVMANIWLFIASVSGYFGLWALANPTLEYKRHLRRFALLVLLCVPFEIGGNVFTVIGNAESDKNIYSVLSFYQKAKQSAYAVVTLLAGQTAGKNAYAFVNLLGDQKAGRDAVVGIGLPVFQEAKKDAVVVFGVSGYQEAGGNTFLGLGLSGYQKAGERAEIDLGVSGYQKAETSAQSIVGVTIYQNVQDEKRVFGAFTKLERE